MLASFCSLGIIPLIIQSMEKKQKKMSAVGEIIFIHEPNNKQFKGYLMNSSRK